MTREDQIQEFSQIIRQQLGYPAHEAERVAALLPALVSDAGRGFAGRLLRRRASVLSALEPDVSQALSEIADQLGVE